MENKYCVLELVNGKIISHGCFEKRAEAEIYKIEFEEYYPESSFIIKNFTK
jgi:hypothetical protein